MPYSTLALATTALALVALVVATALALAPYLVASLDAIAL